MSVLNDESVEFKAGWNAARVDRPLQPNASQETMDGYEAYFLEYSPPIPLLAASEGYKSERSKKRRAEEARKSICIQAAKML